jgi:antitoxin ParD1/3/4
MSAIERLTITLPAEMAGLVKGAVDEGDYASTSEVIREALRDWKLKRELRLRQFAELKAEIDLGMADIVAGRVSEFDIKEIMALGRKLRTDRLKSSAKKIS